MKFYAILLVTFNNGDSDKVGIYTFDTIDAAKKNGYTYLGQYVNADNVETVNVEVKNNLGGQYMNETWEKTVEENNLI